MSKRVNNFDLLISAAAADYVERELRQFLEVDTSVIEPHLKKQGQIRKIRSGPIRSRFCWIKVAVVACLICLSMAFTACMCIPEIRSAIQGVVIEWYENCIGINFEQQQEDPIEPPTTIEQKVYASYLPGSYRCEIESDNTGNYSISFYDLETDEWRFMITQLVINENGLYSDSENQTVEEIVVAGNPAIMVSSIETPDFYGLIWNDGAYIYNLYGYFSSPDELLMLAEGIRLK